MGAKRRFGAAPPFRVFYELAGRHVEGQGRQTATRTVNLRPCHILQQPEYGLCTRAPQDTANKRRPWPNLHTEAERAILRQCPQVSARAPRVSARAPRFRIECPPVSVGVRQSAASSPRARHEFHPGNWGYHTAVTLPQRGEKRPGRGKGASPIRSTQPRPNGRPKQTTYETPAPTWTRHVQAGSGRR